MTRDFREGESCKECKTTERKHQAKGLCVNCYARAYRRKTPEKQKKLNRKHEQTDKRKKWVKEYKKGDTYKTMMKKSSAKYRENNKELVLERTREWRKEKPEKILEYSNRPHVKKAVAKNHLRRKFGENAVTAYERDDGLCRKCGGDNKVAIHHIDWDKETDSLDNLICLCSNCHTTVHRWIPLRLRRELFDEFMKE